MFSKVCHNKILWTNIRDTISYMENAILDQIKSLKGQKSNLISRCSANIEHGRNFTKK